MTISCVRKKEGPSENKANTSYYYIHDPIVTPFGPYKVNQVPGGNISNFINGLNILNERNQFLISVLLLTFIYMLVLVKLYT